MTYRSLLLALLLLPVGHAHADWFFRGTPNGWATTAMTSSDGVRYCTRQSFGSSSPRFKVDRFGDWKEAYPTADYTVAANTTYDICFNVSNKQFDVKVAASDTNQPPVAVISPAGPVTIKVGESLTLSGTGSSDPDGTVASYQWSTGATSASSSFSSATAGSFTVTLTVTDDKGAKASRDIAITVNPASDTGQWFFRGTPNGWATTTMTSSDGVRYCTRQSFGAASPRFKVDRFGDWNEAYPTADYTVAANTTYDICFNSSSKQFDVKIAASDTNQAPIAQISPAGPATIKVGESISLSGTGSSDADGTIAGYQWSTGATSASTSFSSATAGSFTITLTVTDDKGVKASRDIAITVNPASDTGQWFFRGTPNGWATTAMTSSDGVRYCTRQSFGSNSSRFKVDRFGDWKEAYPAADYRVAANTTYDICFDRITKSFDLRIHVNEPPVARAGIDQTLRVVKPLMLDARASTDDHGISGYEWYIDNVLVLSEPQGAIYGLAVGEHQIELKVIDSDGLTATDSLVVTVLPPDVEPPQAVAGDDRMIRQGQTLIFDASASTDNDRIDHYQWLIDGVVVSNEITFSQAEWLPGEHLVELLVTDASDLIGYDQLTISVLPYPEMTACAANVRLDDSPLAIVPPDSEITPIVSALSSVADIELLFNHARLMDNGVETLLKMPSQAVWDSWDIQRQALYLINAEREARGLRSFAGVDAGISVESEELGVYTRLRNLPLTHFIGGRGPLERLSWQIERAGRFAEPLENLAVVPSVSRSDALVWAIYSWLYQDASPAVDPAWTNRANLLVSGYGNSRMAGQDNGGLIGVGVVTGAYDPLVPVPTQHQSVIVWNAIAPDADWDDTKTIAVDTQLAHQCAE